MKTVSLDELAKSVADEVHKKTGLIVGYDAKFDKVGQRILFTFKPGTKYVYDTVSYEEMRRPPGWQPIYERLVQLVCEGGVRRGNHGEPEIPIVVDQSGKRHFRMVAETGYIGFGR